MSQLSRLNPLYKGLILRKRAFASFKHDELETIYCDLGKCRSGEKMQILDPMSGYGGGMVYFGSRGYNTYNIELNAPSYFWQVLINPVNKSKIINIIDQIKFDELPLITSKISISNEFFERESILSVIQLYNHLLKISGNEELSLAFLLPFTARFANFQKSDTDFTHFKQGGINSFEGWKEDFLEYCTEIRKTLTNIPFNNGHHVNILGDFLKINFDRKFSCFVTSPPYPNYRDYSKIFKIENSILSQINSNIDIDYSNMIGSDVVSKKEYGDIISSTANKFLKDLLEKSSKLNKKSQRDIEIYYYPYFALYFYGIQEAYIKLTTILNNDAIGYIVVNNNITRDIEIPVGRTICEIFENIGYSYSIIDESQISHLGNLRKKAKRINSRHVRHIVKLWKK